MEPIVNLLIKALGWSIFHSLWQGAVIYGLMMLVTGIFPKLNARLRHNLAYGAVMVMFAGFCLTFFSLFSLPAAEPLQMAAVVQLKDGTSHDVQQGLSWLISGLGNRAENLFPYLSLAYLTGIVLQLLLIGSGYLKLRKLKHAGHIGVPQIWMDAFERLAGSMGLRRKVVFALSGRVNVPLVIGYLKPVVLFPVALASQLDIEQVEAILIHELSHIRRNDYLLNLVKTGIETLMFFNPFIWLCGKYIGIEREHACDDLVLKYTGKPIAYAHALLKLELLKDKTAPALSLAASGGTRHLYQRIKRITDMKTTYMNAKQQVIAVTLTVATVLSLAWVSPEKNRPAKALPAHPNLEEKTAKKPVLKIMNKTEIRSITTQTVSDDDTAKKKKKFKIVTVDTNGIRREYDSVREMPDSLRAEVVSETFMNGGDFKLDFNLDSTLSRQMVFIKSPEFKKQIEDIKMQASVLSKQLQSKDFKKMQADARKMSEDMARHFNSEAFKKQQENIKKQAEKMKLKAEEMSKKFDSPEFKKQLEEMKKLHDSQEYKQLKEKFDKDLEQLKKEKGIKSDLKTLNFSPDRLIITDGPETEETRIFQAD